MESGKLSRVAPPPALGSCRRSPRASGDNRRLEMENQVLETGHGMCRLHGSPVRNWKITSAEHGSKDGDRVQIGWRCLRLLPASLTHLSSSGQSVICSAEQPSPGHRERSVTGERWTRLLPSRPEYGCCAPCMCRCSGYLWQVSHLLMR